MLPDIVILEKSHTQLSYWTELNWDIVINLICKRE